MGDSIIERSKSKKYSDKHSDGRSMKEPESEQQSASALNDLEADGILLGDIRKSVSPPKKKRMMLLNRLGSSKNNTISSAIPLSLNRKKCRTHFEDDRIMEQSLKSLNPTQYRIAKKRALQSSTPSSSFQSTSSSAHTKRSYSTQRFSTPMTGSFVSPDEINIPTSPSLLSQDIHNSLLESHSIQEILKIGMELSHTSKPLIKDLKIALRNDLIMPSMYREFFLISTGAGLMMRENPGYYDSCLKIRDQYPSSYFDKIKQDSRRSRIDEQSEIGVCEKLENVLSAYAIRNPYVQYCQGMNFIAVFLLRHVTMFNEEEAFWLMCCLLENILSCEMYSNPDFFLSFIALLEEYIKVTMPEVSEKFKAMQMQLLVFPFSEVFTLFMNGINPSISLIILLNLTISGQRELIRSMLALIRLCKSAVLKAENYVELNQALQGLHDFSNVEEFQHEHSEIYINKRAFELAMTEFSERTQAKDSSFTSSQISKIKQELLENDKACNASHPVCLETGMLVKRLRRGYTFFILKIAQPLIPSDQNHFSSADKPRMKRVPSYIEKQVETPPVQNELIDDLLIGRHFHICEIKKKLNTQTNASALSPTSSAVVVPPGYSPTQPMMHRYQKSEDCGNMLDSIGSPVKQTKEDSRRQTINLIHRHRDVTSDSSSWIAHLGVDVTERLRSELACAAEKYHEKHLHSPVSNSQSTTSQRNSDTESIEATMMIMGSTSFPVKSNDSPSLSHSTNEEPMLDAIEIRQKEIDDLYEQRLKSQNNRKRSQLIYIPQQLRESIGGGMSSAASPSFSLDSTPSEARDAVAMNIKQLSAYLVSFSSSQNYDRSMDVSSIESSPEKTHKQQLHRIQKKDSGSEQADSSEPSENYHIHLKKNSFAQGSCEHEPQLVMEKHLSIQEESFERNDNASFSSDKEEEEEEVVEETTNPD